MNYINLELDQGASAVLQVVYQDPITGIPKDLTNCTGKLCISPTPGMPPEITIDTFTGDMVFGGPTGLIRAYFSPTLTKDLLWEQAPFDLFLTENTGVKTKIFQGLVTVIPSESY